MKNKLFNKKLVFLFLIVIIMVIFMFYFLNKDESGVEDLLSEKVSNNLDILETKQRKIEKFISGFDGFFDQKSRSFFNSLKSYIILPLEIGPVGNDYPFGRGESIE